MNNNHFIFMQWYINEKFLPAQGSLFADIAITDGKIQRKKVYFINKQQNNIKTADIYLKKGKGSFMKFKLWIRK